jgi:hypothetical protein
MKSNWTGEEAAQKEFPLQWACPQHGGHGAYPWQCVKAALNLLHGDLRNIPPTWRNMRLSMFFCRDWQLYGVSAVLPFAMNVP